jgi:hypothetical protein
MPHLLSSYEYIRNDLWNSGIRAMIPAVIAIVFALSRRYLTAPPSIDFTERDKKQFARLQWILGPAMLVVLITFAFFTYEVFAHVNRLFALRGGAGAFMILPSHAMWAIFPVFGGICLSWEITLLLWSQFGNRLLVQKYRSWSNSNAGFNTTQLLRIMILFLALPAAIATILALPIHSKFSKEGISIGHFARFQPTEYHYSDVQRIVAINGRRLRDGSLLKQPAIVLYFSDGSHWSSTDNTDTSPDLNESLLIFIQNKTHIPCEHIEALPFGSA